MASQGENSHQKLTLLDLAGLLSSKLPEIKFCRSSYPVYGSPPRLLMLLLTPTGALPCLLQVLVAPGVRWLAAEVLQLEPLVPSLVSPCVFYNPPPPIRIAVTLDKESTLLQQDLILTDDTCKDPVST